MCVVIDTVFTLLSIKALKGISVPLGRLLSGAPTPFLIQDTTSVFRKATISISAVHYLYQAIIHAGTFALSPVSLKSKVTGV